MSIEAKLEALTAAVITNNGLLEQMIAGREQAIGLIAAQGEQKPRATRTKAEPKPAETPPAAATTTETPPAAAATSTTPAAATPAADAIPPEVSPLDLRAAFGAYLGEVDGDARAERAKTLITPMLAHFSAQVGPMTKEDGSPRPFVVTDMTGPNSQKALFFLRRAQAGLPVDFTAAYDFSGSPKQTLAATEAPAAPEDEFGLG